MGCQMQKRPKPSITRNKKKDVVGELPGLEHSSSAILAVMNRAKSEVKGCSRGGDDPKERPAKTVNITMSGVHPVPPVVSDPRQQVLELKKAWDVEPAALFAEELGLNPH